MVSNQHSIDAADICKTNRRLTIVGTSAYWTWMDGTWEFGKIDNYPPSHVQRA